MTYQIINTNDPDLFDFASCCIEIDKFDKIIVQEPISTSLEIVRYLADYGDVYVHRFSVFHPVPRSVIPTASANPKIYVTTLSLRPDILRMEIYIPKPLNDVAVYFKLKYGCADTTPFLP
jgi:hypothetical protein